MTLNLTRRAIAVILVPIVVTQLAGCSAFRPFHETVSIECAQEGVQLKVNGVSYGCPTDVPVRRNKTVDVRASKEGYPTQQRIIRYQISATGILDIAGGLIILVPAIGLAFPGAFDLDSTSVYFDLSRPVAQQPVD
jgi:hypothetical protein